MWVKLKTVKNVIMRGQSCTFHAGDIIQVGGALAKEWLADNTAEELDMALQLSGKLATEPTAGMVIRGGVSQTIRDKLAQVQNLQLTFTDPDDWQPVLPYSENVLWTPSFDLRLDLLLIGFKLLHKWQMAVPLVDYETLAMRVMCSDKERTYTETVIRDLRVPLRDPRLVFIRRCDAMRVFVAHWQEERMRFGNKTHEQLALLRTIYTECPVVCDLPASWTNPL